MGKAQRSPCQDRNRREKTPVFGRPFLHLATPLLQQPQREKSGVKWATAYKPLLVHKAWYMI
jgi:hypothetical protein